MTSKEALKEMLGLTKTHYDYWLKANDYYELIKKDLERLEKINEVWHKNEPMESVDINGNHLQEVYDFIHRLCEENEKLKKAIEILKSNLFIEYKDEGYRYCYYINFKRNKYDKKSSIRLCLKDKKQYELLKGVLEND